MKIPLLIQYGVEVLRGQHKHRDPAHVPSEFWEQYSLLRQVTIDILTWVVSEVEIIDRLLQEDNSLYERLPAEKGDTDILFDQIRFVRNVNVALPQYIPNYDTLYPLLVQYDQILDQLLPLWIECKQALKHQHCDAYRVCVKDIDRSHKLLPYTRQWKISA